MDELKPCPFCGGKAKEWVEFVSYEYDEYEYGEKNLHHCGCKKCGISASFFWDKRAAREAWNRRAEDG